MLANVRKYGQKQPLDIESRPKLRNQNTIAGVQSPTVLPVHIHMRLRCEKFDYFDGNLVLTLFFVEILFASFSAAHSHRLESAPNKLLHSCFQKVH